MKDNKVNKAWKTTTIILIIFTLMMFTIVIVSLVQEKIDNDSLMTCYYDICEDYLDAEYDFTTKVCYCYDYDLLGYPVLNKTEYMGK